MNDVVAVGMITDDHQDQKREEGHQEISRKIDDHGQPGIHCADRRHCDKQVTGMTDTGIGQKALEIRLRQRRKITVEEGGGGQERNRGDQLVSDSRESLKGQDNSQQHDKADRFRTNGEKGGDRSWSTLIDVGNPELKGRSRYLESETDQDQESAKKKSRLIIEGNGRKHLLDLREIGLSRDAIDPGNAVNGKTRGKGAQD